MIVMFETFIDLLHSGHWLFFIPLKHVLQNVWLHGKVFIGNLVELFKFIWQSLQFISSDLYNSFL